MSPFASFPTFPRRYPLLPEAVALVLDANRWASIVPRMSRRWVLFLEISPFRCALLGGRAWSPWSFSSSSNCTVAAVRGKRRVPSCLTAVKVEVITGPPPRPIHTTDGGKKQYDIFIHANHV